MLADLAAALAANPAEFLAGAALTTYGIGLIIGAFYALAYLIATWQGEPDPMPREDADTHVVTVLAAPVEHRQEPAYVQPELVRPYVGTLREEVIEGLRVIPSPGEVWAQLDAAGPVCPTCGGPFGNCSCYGKSAPRRDECPLTTDEIRIPAVGETPAFAATVERAETQDLTVRLDQILGRERVA